MNGVSVNDSVLEQNSQLTAPRKPGRYDSCGNLRQKKETDWQVGDLQQKHHDIKNLVFMGHSNKEIAKLLSCTPQQVANVKNSPIVKDQLLLMTVAAEGGCVDMQKEFQKMQPKALLILREVIDSGTIDGESVSNNTRLKECNTIIDRYIGKPTQNINTQNVTAHLTSEEIKEMKARAIAQMVKTA